MIVGITVMVIITTIIVTVITLCDCFLFKIVNYLYIHQHLLAGGAVLKGFVGPLSGVLRLLC